MKFLFAYIIVFFILISTSSYSQTVKEIKPAGKHHEEHYHLSVFSGYTFDQNNKQGYKIGVEYEHRLTEYVGIGGAFDFTGADYENYAISMGGTSYPFKQVPFIIGVSIGAKNAHSKWKGFLRTQVTYNFHYKEISIGPMLMYDVFSEQLNMMSLGLTLGISLD